MGPPEEDIVHAPNVILNDHIEQYRSRLGPLPVLDRAKRSASSTQGASLHHEEDRDELGLSLSTLDLSNGSPQPAGTEPASASIMMMQRELFKKRLAKKPRAKGIQEWVVCAPPEKHPAGRQSSSSVTVSSTAEIVVPALEKVLAEAVLTDEQRISVQFSIQAIQSRTLYEPRINFAERSAADRRDTAHQLVSSRDLKVDDESFRWLAQTYHLDRYSEVKGTLAPKPLPATTSLHQPEQSQAPSVLKSGSSPWLNRLAPPEKKQSDKEGRESLPRTGSSGELSIEKAQAIGESVSEMLKGIHHRDFDVFEFAAAGGGAVLKPVASAIFNELGVLEKMNIGKQTMDAFLTSIEAGYCEVPYHNACHATDVLLAVYTLILSSSMTWMTDHEVFSLLIAAIIHDFKHPGVSNGYLIASRDPLATRYNDRAVLENYHLASSFSEIYKPVQNIMKGFSSEHQKAIRALIIQLVLITDMSEHFNFVNKFKAFVLGPDFSLEEQQHRLYVFQMILKCADLNSAAKPLRLAKVWADRVTDEFFNQGDLEKKLGLPVSPMCDKQAADIPRQQIRFIDFIVQPMFESFAEHCPALDEWFRDLENNKEYWESQCKSMQASGSTMRRSNSERSLKL